MSQIVLDRDITLDRFVHDGHQCTWCHRPTAQEMAEVGECVSRHPSSYPLTRAQKLEDES